MSFSGSLFFPPVAFRFGIGSIKSIVLSIFLTVAVGMECAFSQDAAETISLASAFTSILTKVDVKPGQTTLPASWEFTNRGDFPLAVERIESSCGCLAAQVGGQVVEPGETGRIEAIFQPGAYRGTLRKSIHVRFVNFPKPIELVMEAHIPSPVEISTNELCWHTDEDPKTQTIEIKSGTGAPFIVTDLLGVNPELFTIAKESRNKEQTSYRLSITPLGKPDPGTHILQVRTNSPDPRDQVFAVFLQVHPAHAHPARPPNSTASTP